MTAVRVPIVGSPTNRGDDLNYDQRFVNCFPEVINNPVTEGRKTYLLKRDGTDALWQPAGATGEGRGIYAWNSKLYTVIEDKLYATTNAGVTTELKTLSTTEGLVGFVEFTAANDYLVLIDGADGYYISTTDVVTEITDAQFPTPHLPFPVFMDGYLFVQKTTGEIFNCDVGDITSWASASYITPESYPDGAIALARQNNMVVAFGVNSVEFFYDAANPSPGSPLGRNLQAIIQYGCASGASISQEEGMCVFVAMSATGEKFVSAIEGTKDVVISTEAVNRILQGEASNIVDCWGFLLRNKGHLLYVLNLPYQARTLVFDMHTKMWHEWEWYDGASDTNFPMIDACEFVDQLHYLHVADGYIYKSSPDIYDDNGNPLRMLVQTSQYDGDSAKVKFFSRIEILADHVSDPSEMTVSWSDDDYKTWSTPRAVDLSGRAYLYRCGSSRRRAFRLYSDADTAIRLNAMEFELTVGTH